MFKNVQKVKERVKMAKSDRRERILEILSERRRVSAREISRLCYSSYSSVRRDLAELEAEGLILRSYGSAELTDTASYLVPYPVRINKSYDEKCLIAKKASALIKDGDTLFIDASSTSSVFAREISRLKGITVFTNNVEIMSMATRFNFDVVSSGGIQSYPNRYALSGHIAEASLSSIHADWAVFSARSLTDGGLIYDVNQNEIAVRSIMLNGADKKMFLCDSSKFGSISTYLQCSLSFVDYLVTDSSADEYKEAFPNLTVI